MNLPHWIAAAPPSLPAVAADGVVSQAYGTAIDLPARVVTAKGREAFQRAATQSARTIRVLLRFRDDVTTDWRITWDGDDYAVTHVDTSGRRQGELWIEAEWRAGAT